MNTMYSIHVYCTVKFYEYEQKHVFIPQDQRAIIISEDVYIAMLPSEIF